MALNKLVGTERKKKTELGTGQDPESREEERVPALPGLEESLGGWSWASAPGTVFASSCWRQKAPEARAAGFSQGAKMLDPYRELLSCVPICPEKPKGRAAYFSTGFGADSVL